MNKNFKISISEALFYIIIMICTGIFLVLNISTNTWRNILSYIIIFFYFFSIIKYKKNFKNAFLHKYLLVFFAIVFFELIRASKLYDYSFSEFLYALRPYIWLILAIPLSYMMKKKNIDFYLIKISQITLISLLIRFITWICYMTSGIVLFPQILNEYGTIWYRNGVIRLDATPLIGILVIVLFYLYMKYDKKKYIIQLVFTFLYMIIVYKTRIVLVGSIVTIAIMILFQKKNSYKDFILKSIIVCGFVFFISFGMLDYLWDYFGIKFGTYALGYRSYELEYYLSLLSDGKWKLGIGVLSNINDNVSNILFGNLTTKMYLDDLGVIETFVQFGLFTIILYGFLYYSLLKGIFICKKRNEINDQLLYLGILVYILISSISCNIFSIQRIIMVPIILAMLSVIFNDYSTNKTK